MSDITTTEAKVLEASSWLLGAANDIRKTLSEAERSHWIEHAIACVKAVYGPLAPFHVGDHVLLKDPPVITKEDSWGWVGHERNLCLNKRGKITDVRWDHEDGAYRVLFEPAKPMFVSSEGVEYPMDRAPQYSLAAKRFVKDASHGS